jgi:hypothetical protein
MLLLAKDTHACFRFLYTQAIMGSFDKFAGTGIFVNNCLEPGIFDKNPYI